MSMLGFAACFVFDKFLRNLDDFSFEPVEKLLYIFLFLRLKYTSIKQCFSLTQVAKLEYFFMHVCNPPK